jgi:hypothetical protein
MRSHAVARPFASEPLPSLLLLLLLVWQVQIESVTHGFVAESSLFSEASGNQ